MGLHRIVYVEVETSSLMLDRNEEKEHDVHKDSGFVLFFLLFLLTN